MMCVNMKKPRCPDCLLEVESESDGKVAWWTCPNCGIDFENTKPPLKPVIN